ncbi:hypothetical protein B0H19DRAFT_972001, partial [Mycena capillaripes]
MPAEVERKLEKRVRKFLWAEKTSVTINKETIYAPADQGGRNLLDILARNEAITITWLKSYLSFGNERPLWAFVADEILARNARAEDLNVDEALRRNMYLQTWRTNTRSKTLPKDLKDLIKVADKYDLQMEGLAISREIQREAIIWYHPKTDATRSMFNRGEQTECLKKNHKIITVGDAERMALKRGTARHSNRRNCRCNACTEVRQTCPQCRAPWRCYERARIMLNSLDNKWNPLEPQPEDYEDDMGNRAVPENENENIFDLRITVKGTLADTFRIFTDGLESSKTAPNTMLDPEPDEEPIVVYTDESAKNSGTANAQAGAGIFLGQEDIRNRAIRVPDELGPSNQVGEILGIKEA